MILIISEKPSVGRAVSAVVGADKTHKGYIEGGGYIVSWCVGHLVGLKYPNDYGNGWEERWSFSQLPMIPDKWQFTVTESTKVQYNLLKILMFRDDVTEIICATDADREGECIFRYVYNMAKCTKPVKRLWVSSLEESAIRSALASMKPMSAYDNLFDAGYARARADWLVGMNGSRLFSVRYGGKLNIGRVQIMTSKAPARRCEDVDQQALTYSEIKALCTGDERIKEKLMLENEVKELRVLAAEHKNTVYEMQDKIAAFPEKEQRLQATLDGLYVDRETLRKLPIDPERKLPVFKITIQGTEYTDRKEAAKAFEDAALGIRIADTPVKIGSFQGFDLSVTVNSSAMGGGMTAKMQGQAAHSTKLIESFAHNLNRLESALYNIDGRIEGVKENLAKLRLDHAEAQKIVSEPFPQQAELDSNYSSAVTKTFKECFSGEFALLHQSFSNWTEDVLKNGFFSSIKSMNELISNYTDLLETITKNYSGYTSAVQNKIGYILNIFNIISDSDFLDSAKSSEVIVPAYNPAMLEKIIARNDYIIFSFRDLIDHLDTLKFSEIENKFRDFGKLAAITQGVDMIPCGSDKLICKNVWGFYAIYYGENYGN